MKTGLFHMDAPAHAVFGGNAYRVRSLLRISWGVWLQVCAAFSNRDVLTGAWGMVQTAGVQRGVVEDLEGADNAVIRPRRSIC
jgi:hypothetical protein